MKLSDVIQIWRTHLRQCRDVGTTVTPAGMRDVEEALEGAFEAASRMERTIDWQEAEIHALKARVSRMSLHRPRVVAEDLGPNVALFPIVPRPVPARTPPEGGAA